MHQEIGSGAPSLVLCSSHLLPHLFALLSVPLPFQPIHQTYTHILGLTRTHVCLPTVSTLSEQTLRHMHTYIMVCIYMNPYRVTGSPLPLLLPHQRVTLIAFCFLALLDGVFWSSLHRHSVAHVQIQISKCKWPNPGLSIWVNVILKIVLKWMPNKCDSITSVFKWVKWICSTASVSDVQLTECEECKNWRVQGPPTIKECCAE